MELTGLEMTLIGGGIATVAAWISTTIQSRFYQSKAVCDDRHKGVCDKVEGLESKQRRDSSQAMRMLRSLVIHSDIPESEKERILNDREEK